MKNIRRSLNKDKQPNSPPQGGSRTPNTASPPLPQNASSFQPIAKSQATQPPQKVIKAAEGYRARSPIELSFEKGDFFYVVGERPEQGMFDAHNPLTGARGLVPRHCFETLGRTERESRPAPAAAAPLPAANGSYSSSSRAAVAAQPQPQAVVPTKRISSSQKSGTLYGVVQYDFAAERHDELDAKRGDNILIIAQSNHEWFVAKPIGRLGGPGLIPVSFVEIQNMQTGKAMDPMLVQEMIRGGTLPGVEEWKKSTAEYKEGSIPLGRFDFPGAQSQQQQQQQPQPPPPSQRPSQAPLNGGSSRTPGEYSSGATKRSDVSSMGSRQVSSHHETSSSRLTPSYPPKHQSHSSPALGERHSYPTETARFSSSNRSESSIGGSAGPSGERYGLVSQAVVDSFHYEENSYWFHLRVSFDSGAALVLYRLYDDFYEFHTGLLRAFPIEAGEEDPRTGEKRDRILPMMPGPADMVDEAVCAKRVGPLNVYLKELCVFGVEKRVQHLGYIKRHPLFDDFFLARPGDIETQGPSRRSTASNRLQLNQAEDELVEQLKRMPRSAEPQRISSSEPSRASLNGKRSYDGLAQRGNTPSPAPTNNTAPQTPGGGPQPSFLKIKIFQRTTDDLIAIRVPPGVSLMQLMDKASERLGIDVHSLKWREDMPGMGTGGGARLVELIDDVQLDRWVKSGARLVLYAD